MAKLPIIIPPKPPLAKVKDLQESTVNVVSGLSLRGTEKIGAQTYFLFDDTEELATLKIKFYNNELLLNPRDVFTVWRGLRSMTFSSGG